jgi:hypothetical protein
LPDGKRGTAINVIRKIDDDRMGFSSSGRHVDDEMLPNVEEVEIVRDDVSADDDSASDHGSETSSQ